MMWNTKEQRVMIDNDSLVHLRRQSVYRDMNDEPAFLSPPSAVLEPERVLRCAARVRLALPSCAPTAGIF